DRAAVAMQKALAEIPTIAGLPHDEQRIDAVDLEKLPATWAVLRPSIVYVTPGFSDPEIGAIVASLRGVDVLSAGALPAYVPLGIVLGFDLVSGRPKVLVHLTQARRQHVWLG